MKGAKVRRVVKMWAYKPYYAPLVVRRTLKAFGWTLNDPYRVAVVPLESYENLVTALEDLCDVVAVESDLEKSISGRMGARLSDAKAALSAVFGKGGKP